jgi:hypothetical protein
MVMATILKQTHNTAARMDFMEMWKRCGKNVEHWISKTSESFLASHRA